MDSRDIKKEPDAVLDNSYLEHIYEMQKNLLKGYIDIEGLPQYPININTKKNQILIKDFVGRVIEELAESYESLVFISEAMEESLYLTSCDDYRKTLVSICNHLQNTNEELADALHFMVELLIYANIQPEDIDRYLNKVLRNVNLSSKLPVGIANMDTLTKSMEVGLEQLKEYTPYMEYNQYNTVDILTRVSTYNDEVRNSELGGVIETDNRLLMAGSIFSVMKYISYKSVMWDVSYHLNIARNYLKNKPWKRSQMMTDEIRFQEEIVIAFITMMGLFKYMGIEKAEEIYLLYFKKNQVNLFRQRSQY